MPHVGVHMPPSAKAGGLEDDLPTDEEEDEPLLDPKKPSSEVSAAMPMSPRDKFRDKSNKTPLTPRSAAKKMEEDAQRAMQDPVAAAEAAKKALADADPAAAALAAEAEARLARLKSNPTGAAADMGKEAWGAAMNWKDSEDVKNWDATKNLEAAKLEGERMAAQAKILWEEMVNDRPPPICPMDEVSSRTDRYIDLLVTGLDGKLPASMPPDQLKGYIVLAAKILNACSGWIAFIIRWVVRIYNALPINVAQMIFGAALCYFGGTFVTTIAAAEAFRTMGYEKAAADVKALWAEIKPVLDKNAEDDLVDDDGDGISDVDQMSPQELMQRKVFLIVTTVKHPERIQSAIGSVYAGLLAVLATLKLEFAATTAMAMGVADMVKKPLVRVGKPKIEELMDLADAATEMAGQTPVGLREKTGHWIEPGIDFVVRIVAISAAWYLQQIISAFYSALRGGKLFADGLFNILVEKAKIGIVVCPGMVGVDYDPEDSILDDVIGWIIAAQGFMFQFNTGFALPFPFSLILAPLSMLELYLKVQISGGLDGESSGTSTVSRRMAEALVPDPHISEMVWNASAVCAAPSGVCWCSLDGASGLTCSA